MFNLRREKIALKKTTTIVAKVTKGNPPVFKILSKNHQRNLNPLRENTDHTIWPV
jgi:hypothetical protein